MTHGNVKGSLVLPVSRLNAQSAAFSGFQFGSMVHKVESHWLSLMPHLKEWGSTHSSQLTEASGT